MKIAAGCFGCLALLMFGLVVVFNFFGGMVLSSLTDIDPSISAAVSPMFGIVSYVADGCCCLSGALSIVLFAVGMSRGNNEAVE
jgi:hypothetical protein